MQGSHAEPAAEDVHRCQMALMFTDIVGYSQLMGENESQCIAMLGDYRRILISRIKEQQGTVVEFIGDAIFARFPSANAAVHAGLAIQRGLKTYNQMRDSDLPQLQARVGIHLGDVTLRDGAVFGDDVNIAARLEPLAVAGSICVSEPVYEAVRDNLQIPSLRLGVQRLKNINRKKIRAWLLHPDKISLKTRAHYWNRHTQDFVLKYRYAVATLGFLMLAACVYFIPRLLVPGYDANYLEIAQFRNVTNENGEPDYFSGGITDTLRAQLADVRNLYVVDPDEGVRGPVRLQGSVQKIGDNIRIAWQLIRRKSQTQIIGGVLDGVYDDIFILQDQLVADIATQLEKEFRIPVLRPTTPRVTSDLTAYSYYLKGMEGLQQSDSHNSLDNAIQNFSKALIHDREFALANAGLCRAYQHKFYLTRQLDWATRSENYCKRAQTQDDTISEVYISLGTLYRHKGLYSDALMQFEQALRLKPENITSKLEIARILISQNLIDKAELKLLKIIKDNPNSWRARQALASLYLSNGQFDNAITTCKEILKITPENNIAYSNLGAAYLYQGNYASAAESFEKTLTYMQSSWGFSNAGTMYYFSKNYKKASKMFSQAIKLAPDDYRLFINFGDALRQLNQQDAAKKSYEKTIKLALKGLELNEQDAQIYQYLALGYFFTGKIEKAQINMNKAILLAPENIDVMYANTRLQSLLGKPESAKLALKKLIEAGYSEKLAKADPDISNVFVTSENL